MAAFFGPEIRTANWHEPKDSSAKLIQVLRSVDKTIQITSVLWLTRWMFGDSQPVHVAGDWSIFCRRKYTRKNGRHLLVLNNILAIYHKSVRKKCGCPRQKFRAICVAFSRHVALAFTICPFVLGNMIHNDSCPFDCATPALVRTSLTWWHFLKRFFLVFVCAR